MSDFCDVNSLSNIPATSAVRLAAEQHLPGKAAKTIRPKARGLVQHGGLPGRLEESGPAECDSVRDGLSVPPSLADHTTLTPLGAELLLKHHHKLL
jgi:hypothetical protein